jgi:hypothetical protein
MSSSFYAASPSGAGKTHNIVARACELAREHSRVLILQPTRELIKRTIENEVKPLSKPPECREFTQATIPSGKSVVREIIDYLNKAEDVGQVVFATHQAFSYIPYIANKGDWHLFIDEEMQILKYFCYRLPSTHSIITDDIDLKPYNAIYSQVIPLHSAQLERKGRNEVGDEILARLSDGIRTLTNRNWNTYVNTEQYHKLLQGRIGTLAFHSVLDPKIMEGFAGVFMATANFEDTAICQLWEDRHTFKEDKEFSSSLRFNRHENGHLISIYHCTDSPWSRKTAERVIAGDDTRNIRHRLIDATRQLFRDERFLWQGNKSVETSPFGDNAIRLPNKPHGLNIYSDVHNISFLSALNPPPDHFNFLRSEGLGGDAVRHAIYHQTAYQSVMRTSIRNPRNYSPKRIIVPDIGLAKYLQCKFPNSRMERLDIGAGLLPKGKSGRPRTHASNAARVAAQRQKRQKENLKILSDLLTIGDGQGDLSRQLADENRSSCRAKMGIRLLYSSFGTAPPVDSLLVKDYFPQPCAGTIYPDKYARLPLCYLRWMDADTFIRILGLWHIREIKNKKEAMLMSPAVFDPALAGDKDRGTENIKYLRNLWLDFEDGELRPDQFPDLFPNLRMLVTNTFHHTREKPRFRVIIPTSQAITPETYKLIYGHIAGKLEDAGYLVIRGDSKNRKSSKPSSGLDWSKSLPTSLFYLPSQAQDPTQSFIRDYDGPGRASLEPTIWVKHGRFPLAPSMEHHSESTPENQQVDELRVDRAKNEWRRTPRGHGNDAFFKLAVRRKRAGMTLSQIESLLREELKYSHSPNEREAQIPGILTSLRTGPHA